MLDQLAARGIVSEPQGIGPRQIVMSQDDLVAILNGRQDAVPDDAGEGAAAETAAAEDSLFGNEEEAT